MTPVEITYFDLLECFYDLGLSEVEGMNVLQDQGVISDNCVWATDVATDDISKAIVFLNQMPK